tara:strand:- start:268 stop:567 length:300 start_codon:yes stop_codon:yes gene_type:complete
MRKFIYLLFSTFCFFPLCSYADDSFSVEIEALTLVMEKYKNNYSENEDIENNNPSYMAFKQDECNAKVEVTEKNGLQINTMQSFEVNVCKKEIVKTINN